MCDDKPSDVNNKGNSGKEDRHSTKNAQPIVVTIEPQTKNKNPYDAKGYRLERAKYRIEKKAYCVAKYTMIFMIAYTGLTLVIAASSIITTWIAKTSADSAAKSTKDTLAEMHNQTNAMQASADATVAMADFQVVWPGAANVIVEWKSLYREENLPFIDMRIGNDGLGSARLVNGVFDITFGDSAPSRPYKFLKNKFKVIALTIPPGGDKSPRFLATMPLSPEQTLSLKSKPISRVYVWGVIRYWNSKQKPDGEKPSSVEFCWSTLASNLLSKTPFPKGKIHGGTDYGYDDQFDDCSK